MIRKSHNEILFAFWEHEILVWAFIPMGLLDVIDIEVALKKVQVSSYSSPHLGFWVCLHHSLVCRSNPFTRETAKMHSISVRGRRSSFLSSTAGSSSQYPSDGSSTSACSGTICGG